MDTVKKQKLFEEIREYVCGNCPDDIRVVDSSISRKKKRGMNHMNEPYGYYTAYCYRGYVERLGQMIEFATREEYYEYIKEDTQCI